MTKKLLLQQIKSGNPDLKLAEIEGILYLIKSSSTLTNNELIQQTGLPKETLRVFKDSISHYLNDSDKSNVTLTPKSLEILENIKFKPFSWSLLNLGDLVLEDKFGNIRKKYNLEPKRGYDQFFATKKTSVAKAKIIAMKGLIEGMNIALLGDDDLVSIVLGLMFPEQTFKVTVFDIDKDILAAIETICRDLSINNVQTQVLDLRNNINTQFLHIFDAVMTDPPYTKSGTSLFIKRGIELLKKPRNYNGSYLFLFYGNSFKSPEKELKIQEIISKHNLLITDKIEKFAVYTGAESIGSSSSLYILKTTPFTNVINNYVSNEIYTFQEIREEKFPFVDHLVFKLNNVPNEIINSKKSLLKSLGVFCVKHRFKVVDTKVTQFKGLGLSVTFILANSNLVIHTWPEHNAIHIDLITCKPIFAKEDLYNSLSRLFSTKNIEITRIE